MLYPDRLDPEIQKTWLEALRSGKYRQGKARLKLVMLPDETPRYCCLGVLAEVTGLPCDKGETNIGLPIQKGMGMTYGLNSDCIAWNDQLDKTFAEIADLIEHYDYKDRRE